MAATTGLSCVDYIAFKFGCQSISRDPSEGYYRSPTQAPLFGRSSYTSNTWSIERWFEDFTKHDLQQRNQRSCFDFEKQFKMSCETSNESFYNTDSKGTVCPCAQSDRAGAQTGKHAPQDKKTKHNAISEKTREQDTQKHKLTEITNQISMLDAEDDLCSDSELELQQIYEGRRSEKSRSVETHNQQLEVSLQSRKRPFGDKNIGRAAKRKRPSIDFYSMCSSRTKGRTSLDRHAYFVPIAASL